ncbi:hypothetical protein D3C80_330640 [compost metagenome]
MLVASIYGMNTDVLPFARGTTSFVMVGIICWPSLLVHSSTSAGKNGFKHALKALLLRRSARNAPDLINAYLQTIKKHLTVLFYLVFKQLTANHFVNDRLE